MHASTKSTNTVEFPLGKTVRANLRARCKRDHLYKTFGPNTTRTEPDGTVITTSPTGKQTRSPIPPFLDIGRRDDGRSIDVEAPDPPR